MRARIRSTSLRVHRPMTNHPGLEPLIACPRCDKTPLDESSDGYRCSACKVDFPRVGGVPWLFAEPDAALGEWRNRLHFALQQLATTSQEATAALAGLDEDSLAYRRLSALAAAKDAHRQALRKLLAPLDIRSSAASPESYLAKLHAGSLIYSRVELSFQHFEMFQDIQS